MEQPMTLVDKPAAGPGGRSETGERSVSELRLTTDGAWRDDVALEMWIDVTAGCVAIRLAGVLDDSTGANLVGVVAECVAEGQVDVELGTSALRVKGWGGRVLDGIYEHIIGCRWTGAL
jgi:hypothetical protein